MPNLSCLWKHPAYTLALGFGSGLSPKAPGTAGTIAATPIFLLLLQLPVWGYVLFVAAALILGIVVCGKTATYLQVPDHPAIVWDEFVGLWIALLPLALFGFSWLDVLLGFALFRLFDIWKPWPIGFFDKKVHGGLGIMLDDVVAGVFSAIALLPLLL